MTFLTFHQPHLTKRKKSPEYTIQSNGRGCNKSYMILYSTEKMSHFWTIWDPVRSSGGFFKASIHCFNVLFLERCYTPTKHIFKTKRAQNFGASFFFKPTPPFFDKKMDPKQNFQTFNFGSPQVEKGQPVQLRETKMAVAPLVAPVASETQQNSERFLRELFGGWQRFWGRGFGGVIKLEMSIKKATPVGEDSQMGFSGRDFPGSASVFG